MSGETLKTEHQDILKSLIESKGRNHVLGIFNCSDSTLSRMLAGKKVSRVYISLIEIYYSKSQDNQREF